MNKKSKYKLQLRNVHKNKVRVLKWCNTSKKVKWNAKFKNLYRVGIMYNLKAKLSTEWKASYD